MIYKENARNLVVLAGFFFVFWFFFLSCGFLNLKKNLFDSFGCIRSQLQRAGSELHHVGCFAVSHGLSSQGVRVQLPHSVWNLSSLTKD